MKTVQLRFLKRQLLNCRLVAPNGDIVIVENISPSPYWAEEEIRVYIVEQNLQYADWILISELQEFVLVR